MAAHQQQRDQMMLCALCFDEARTCVRFSLRLCFAACCDALTVVEGRGELDYGYHITHSVIG